MKAKRLKAKKKMKYMAIGYSPERKGELLAKVTNHTTIEDGDILSVNYTITIKMPTSG